MVLLVGTGDGVYRAMGGEAVEDTERVLDCSRVVELTETDGTVYAATESGLYVTADGGDSWDDLGVPGEEVWSVHVADDGRRYAGCYPAKLFVSSNGGQWDVVSSIESAPNHERWYCPGDEENGRIRTIRTVPGRPDRLLVGVEVGGLYVSDDRGETWTERRGPVGDDVHHVNVRGADEYLVCCGKLDLEQGHGRDGLFRTTDGGDAWERLALDEQSYVRESLVHDGTVYVSGARVTPGNWDGDRGAQATLFESRDDGTTFTSVDYPGKPQEIVLSWAVEDGRVYGGTGTRVYDEGRIIRRDPDGWTDVGRVPTNAYSLASV